MSDIHTGSPGGIDNGASSGSFDHGSGSSAATQTESRPAPGSAASLRPIPGAPPRSQQTESADHGDQSASRANGEAPETNPETKTESRYERSKREKAEWRAHIEAFQREKAEFDKRVAEFEESKKPKRSYTLEQLKQYREEWNQEGKDELVAKADQAIAQMEEEQRQQVANSRTVMELPKYGTDEHRKIWEASEADIRSQDPEFGVKGTRIDTKLREILSGPDGQMYRDHPYGIYAAHTKAQNAILKEENAQLKSELQRVTGLTSINGGVPGRIGKEDSSISTKDFAKLSSAEMRRRLIAGRDRPDNSLGML